MPTHRTRIIAYLLLLLLFGMRAAGQPIPFFNSAFELDAAVASPSSGWTVSAGMIYVTSGSGRNAVDPTAAFSATRFLTANRMARNPDATFPTAQRMSILQTVNATSSFQLSQRDVVHGNLIQFTENGAWSWFQDERAIIDRQRDKLLVGSIANRSGVGGEDADGWVKTTLFDLRTGACDTSRHKDVESYGAGDDHNVPAYLKLPNGNYVTFYAAHNQISNNGPYPNDGGPRIENYKSYLTHL